ncbi:MAG: aldo/keto reductase [Burkholderiaceae bacterium]|nr:aldo/keto reductase [Burkholderiaceae bacterium]
MKRIALPEGERIPALGLGTWKMGERADRRGAEVAALRRGIELGMNLVDTAEMYAEGGAEEVVGEAIAAVRDEVFLVSKVYPHNAGREDAVAACERSLSRLRTDRIDLYLLHWRGSVPLAETVEAFERLRAQGKIRHWGVSNFDVDDMDELAALAGGAGCCADQVYYSVSQRGVEHDLAPWLRRRSIPMMAYCPLDEGALVRDARLAAIARRHGASAAQVAIAWLLSREAVVPIPKAARVAHVESNHAATRLVLEPEDLAGIDRAFPPPRGKRALAMV